jgi:hypothetical protein
MGFVFSGFLEMLASMQTREEDEFNQTWAKSTSSSGASTPKAQKLPSPVSTDH